MRGRKIANWATNVETLWGGIQDTLFGFRVYPVPPLLAVMNETRWMRRFDFDAEAVLRLFWRGVRPIFNLARTWVRHFCASIIAASPYFNYWRDNVLLYVDVSAPGSGLHPARPPSLRTARRLG